MNLYSKKSRWKLLLLIGGALIVLASLWYTSYLAGHIADEEKKKVRIWAEATENKAQLLRYTNQLFDKIREEEKEKVDLWATAMKEVLGISDLDRAIDPFVFKVITSNESVPIILTDSSQQIISIRNLQGDTLYSIFSDSIIPIRTGTRFTPRLKRHFTRYEPIEVDLIRNKNFIYYQDSKLFRELRVALNELINSFISELVVNSASVPVIFTDDQSQVISFGNLDEERMKDPAYVERTIAEMKTENDPIQIDFGEGNLNYVYYKDSPLLKQMRYFPFVQFGIIGVFLFIAYLAFSNARRMEQNQVWVGMAKETAHQLGTPISSLSGWMEVLRDAGVSASMLQEMEKDVGRLELVAERFSKIGSDPELHPVNVIEILKDSIGYMSKRASKKVEFELIDDCQGPCMVALNVDLFKWVIENIIKNGLDAMEGVGHILVDIKQVKAHAQIDVSDSGKGIPKSKFKTVFRPGYSTKKRGWGLGLSLSKRIIENYHAGKIFVASSNMGKGTTFRILLPLS